MHDERGGGRGGGRIGRRGFLFTLTMMLVFVGLFFLLGDVSAHRSSARSDQTSALAAYAIFHVWHDVNEGINSILGVNVSREDSTARFKDSLPADADLGKFLEGYGTLIATKYTSPGIQVIFLDATDNPISLSALSSLLTLSPYGIKYGYPDFGKNELWILSPVENLTTLSGLSIDVHVTDQLMNETLFQWAPYQGCNPNDICITANVTVRDNFTSWTSPVSSFDVTRQSQITIHFGTDSSNHWVKILVGEGGGNDPKSVLNVKLHNLAAATDTKILLNSPDFLISYIAKLVVNMPGIAGKTDWLQ
ncbi:hypothetical protein HY546_02280 [archaeon]|nr:hypothetical protein [archaeon]